MNTSCELTKKGTLFVLSPTTGPSAMKMATEQIGRSLPREFRTAPLEAAKTALKHDSQTLIINGDLASFYDTVDASFMLSEAFLAELVKHSAPKDDIDEYKRATTSLLKAYARFHKAASKRSALTINVGIPIGALTSRVVANVSLAPLDQHIAGQPGMLCYRRYVDDLVIVARAPEGTQGLVETMRRFLPLLPGDADVLRLDVNALCAQAPSSNCRPPRSASISSQVFRAPISSKRSHRTSPRP